MIRNLTFILVAIFQMTLLHGQIVKNGIADLTNHDFNTSPSIELNGTWNFYQSSFITTLNESILETPSSIKVPLRWDQSDYPAKGFGTYELTIIKNANAPLAIRVPYIFSSYNFFINGILMTKMGTPGINENTSIPGWQVKLVPTSHFKSDTLQLLIQVSNFDYSKGGIGKPLVIGTHEYLFEQKFIKDVYDVFFTGCLVMGGFFFLGLYFYGRRKKMTLFFALFCLVYAYRIVGWGNYLIHDLVDIPIKLAVVLEYGSLYLCGYFFASYIKHLFPDEAPKLLINAFAYFSLLWTFLTLLPLEIVSQINIFFLYGLLYFLIVTCFIFIKAGINRRLGARFSVYATITILSVSVLRALDYLEIMEAPLVIVLLGQLLFFLFQGLILSKHFSSIWREAKQASDNAVAAKSEFISVMSHEIRTPLNAVIGITNELSEENPRKDQLHKLDILKNSSENLLSLINNVLDFGKIDANKVEIEVIDVRLEKYCSDILGIFKYLTDQKGIDLQFEFDKNLPLSVKLDKTRVNQIITNLLANAVKFTNKGHVKFRVTQSYRNAEEVGVKFSIEDTGIGVSDDQHEDIFQSFQQAKGSISEDLGGTGLGLSITKKLIQIMGSEIHLESKLGSGSTFTFTLPLEIGNEKNIINKKLEMFDLKGYKVLLVDDNNVNVMIAKNILKKWNLNIEVAENGEIAVQKAREGAFDIILMDLRMPVMTGYEATKILREYGFEIPILALTAASKSHDLSKFKELGFDEVVIKPYNKEDLFMAISKNLIPKPV